MMLDSTVGYHSNSLASLFDRLQQSNGSNEDTMIDDGRMEPDLGRNRRKQST